MRKTLVSIVCALLLVVSCASVVQKERILDMHISAYRGLNTLARGLDREMAVCLHGRIVGDTTFVDLAVLTDIVYSDSIRVRFNGCEPSEDSTVIGWWHNHPGFKENKNPAAGCYLSPTDLKTTRNRYKIAVVSVDHNNMCWFYQDQLLHQDSTSFVYPFPGQIFENTVCLNTNCDD